MHDTILGPARRPSPQLSANAELQLFYLESFFQNIVRHCNKKIAYLYNFPLDGRGPHIDALFTRAQVFEDTNAAEIRNDEMGLPTLHLKRQCCDELLLLSEVGQQSIEGVLAVLVGVKLKEEHSTSLTSGQLHRLISS